MENILEPRTKEKLGEFKILFDSPSTCQKLLNQWKHEFELDIYGMAVQDKRICILLYRTKKNKGGKSETSKI